MGNHALEDEILERGDALGVVAREKAPEEPSPEGPLREPLLNEEEKADAAEAPGP